MKMKILPIKWVNSLKTCGQPKYPKIVFEIDDGKEQRNSNACYGKSLENERLRECGASGQKENSLGYEEVIDAIVLEILRLKDDFAEFGFFAFFGSDFRHGRIS